MNGMTNISQPISQPPPVCIAVQNTCSDMCKFVPHDSCIAPLFETEQEHDAANALLELQNIVIW